MMSRSSSGFLNQIIGEKPAAVETVRVNLSRSIAILPDRYLLWCTFSSAFA